MAISQKVNSEDAKRVARNFYLEKTHNTVNQPVITEEFKIEKNEVLLYYVFNVNDGYIIVSSERSVFPVLGYSFTSNFIENNYPPAFEAWMKQYASQIKQAKIKGRNAAPLISNTWKHYIADDFTPQKDSKGIAPMLQSTWHQGCYYNSQFPADTNGPCGHLWAGCVSTAMGQLMKYYNWPKNGIGENSYSSSYGWVEADFENTTYDWAGMKHHLTGENPAVAQLLYHTAISVNSQFFPNGTGAYDFDARDALVDHFKYKDDAQFLWRDSYQGDWKALLRAELDAGRPFLYGGVDSQTLSGHTLVCDGYQDTVFFHFNWGWNGVYNGYFYIDSLIAGNNYFDFQHDAVIGLSPDITGPIVTNPPESLTAEVDFNDVSLNWDHSSAISTLELIGYLIYRNDLLLTESVWTELAYIDSDVPAGSHQYRVQGVFIGQGQGPSATAEAYVSNIQDQFSSQIELFPNPTSDKIFISSSRNFQINRLELLDISGRIILTQPLKGDNSGKLQISLPDDLSGIFVLRLQTESFTIHKKILIL
jgi:hypothetical protein